MNTSKKIPPLLRPEVAERTWSARESWRVFGIMAEFVEATERLRHVSPAVSIFGSARARPDSAYFMLAQEIARKLSDAGFSILSGGGPGIMEAANKGAYFGRSLAVGLNIDLPQEEASNVFQDVSQTFHHFFARKVMFVKFASAYVVMPGGFGTLDELMEALTLVQTGKTRRIPIILVHEPFWRGLIDWMRNTLIAEGMIDSNDINLFTIVNDPDDVVKTIFDHYETRGFEPSAREREIQLNL